MLTGSRLEVTKVRWKDTSGDRLEIISKEGEHLYVTRESDNIVIDGVSSKGSFKSSCIVPLRNCTYIEVSIKKN